MSVSWCRRMRAKDEEAMPSLMSRMSRKVCSMMLYGGFEPTRIGTQRASGTTNHKRVPATKYLMCPDNDVFVTHNRMTIS